MKLSQTMLSRTKVNEGVAMCCHKLVVHPHLKCMSLTDIFGSEAAVPLPCGIRDQISQICLSSPRVETKRDFKWGCISKGEDRMRLTNYGHWRG